LIDPLIDPLIEIEDILQFGLVGTTGYFFNPSFIYLQIFLIGLRSGLKVATRNPQF
jgi:hypothetical protein